MNTPSLTNLLGVRVRARGIGHGSIIEGVIMAVSVLPVAHVYSQVDYNTTPSRIAGLLSDTRFHVAGLLLVEREEFGGHVGLNVLRAVDLDGAEIVATEGT